MTITRDFKLRLNDGSSSPLMIRANQYDSGEIWRFTLFGEDGVKYNPSSAIILGTTMSGTLVTRDATIKDDKVIVEESRSMTQSSGLNLFELVIDGGSHGTANFIVAVEPRPNKVFLSENDLQTMEKAIEAGASVGGIRTQVEANTSAIESEKTARQNEDSALHSEIESVRSAVGSPLVAPTAAEMTNTNKVYVYTGSETGYTAGNWYYYNGSAWVDGGVYNSVAFNTDKTLSVEGSAADAKKTGDAVSGLNNEIVDARVGVDGSVYSNLGTAIRSQVNDLKSASNVIKTTAGDRLLAIESALYVNSVFKTTVGDRLFAIESALNKLITSEFSTKQYDYVLDEKLEPILDEIGDPIIADGTDLVLSGPALSGVKDYLFNPESENRWNVWGWSGKTVVIPILYVYGHIPGSKGEGKFKVRYQFKDINGQDLVGVGKIGVQGQSSSGLPKKNYSITFADKFLAKDDWLPSKKYTFKSCWNDPTWARNAVSGRLWAQCVASRPNVSYEPILDEKKDSLLDQNGDPITVPSYPIDVYPNHGTYDGFPIYIIANGKYIGLYTMLIAKDKDMFGIGQYKQYKKTECVVSNEGAGRDGAGGFKRANLVVDAEEGEDVTGKSTAWTYECIPNEKPKPSDYDKGVDDDAYKEDLSKYEADNTKFRASLNTMIQAVVNSTGTDGKDTNYKKVSAQYLDYDSVVDYMIFSSLINAADDVGKNWLLVTYDGTKWFFSAYDLDTTWGNFCPDYNNPNLLWRPDEGSPSIRGWNDYNRAMHMIWTYDPQRLIDRYEYLRSTVFSEENVYREFLSFIRKIPMNAIEADRRLFRTEPNGMDFAQLENWYRLRVKKMDKQIEDLKASIATA